MNPTQPNPYTPRPEEPPADSEFNPPVVPDTSALPPQEVQAVPATVSAGLATPATTAVSPAESETIPSGAEAQLLSPVSWVAHEYLHFEKNALWYVIFSLVVLGFIALDMFVLKSYTFSAVVVIMAIAVVVFAHRPPRAITYTLDSQTLQIENQPHSLSDFRAFGVIEDTGHHSVMLIPRKRFAPGLTIYFPEESSEQIVDILGHVLPMEEHRLDAIDKLVRLLRL